jgi:hypothetical protein
MLDGLTTFVCGVTIVRYRNGLHYSSFRAGSDADGDGSDVRRLACTTARMLYCSCIPQRLACEAAFASVAIFVCVTARFRNGLTGSTMARMGYSSNTAQMRDEATAEARMREAR